MEALVLDLRDVRSVTEFQRNLKDYVGRLRAKKTPLVLTVNGRAELVFRTPKAIRHSSTAWSEQKP